jgi:hypothetical protein
MTKIKFISALLLSLVLVWSAQVAAEEKQPSYAGSSSCRECHEKFYQLWSTSMHGLAMQPYTPEFAGAKLTPQQNDVVIGKFKYRADVNEGVSNNSPRIGYTLSHLNVKLRA